MTSGSYCWGNDGGNLGIKEPLIHKLNYCKSYLIIYLTCYWLMTSGSYSMGNDGGTLGIKEPLIHKHIPKCNEFASYSHRNSHRKV